eukprot:m.39456 g.39456  ORF g.39456 m.39456 type:complete len:86 (+) comp18203_c0_seq1:2264-2521(+)
MVVKADRLEEAGTGVWRGVDAPEIFFIRALRRSSRDCSGVVTADMFDHNKIHQTPKLKQQTQGKNLTGKNLRNFFFLNSTPQRNP